MATGAIRAAGENALMELFVRPAGPVDAEEIAQVQKVTWKATYSRLLPADSLARVQQSWNAAHWRKSLERADDRVVTLVMDGQRSGIVGFCVGGRRRGLRDPLLRAYDGEIYLLYLLRSVQGRGNGARMMTAMARVLLARGMNSALVWALATNQPAIGFYQHLSGSILTRCRRPFFGDSVDEIALGWRDISVLARQSRYQPG
jgi:GNAT superfamily N-acetyltransferase